MADQKQFEPSPAAAAAAAVAAAGTLPVLLQQEAFTSEFKAVCQLMRASKATRAAVLEYCKGQLKTALLDVDSCGKAQQIGEWLSRYGGLLRSLRVSVIISSNSQADALSGSLKIAGGLQQAAAAPPGLHLQEVTAVLHHSVVYILLHQLPPQHMRRLVLEIEDLSSSADFALAMRSHHFSFHVAKRQTCEALAGLTGLQSLALIPTMQRSYYYEGTASGNNNRPTKAPGDPYMPGIAALQQLTYLDLSGCSKALLPTLPAQLQCLQLNDLVLCTPEAKEEPLQLGHLTALWELKLYDCNGGFVLSSLDVLPPNVQQLLLDGVIVKSALPFAALTDLEYLEVETLEILSGQFLAGIAHLSKLTSLKCCGKIVLEDPTSSDTSSDEEDSEADGGDEAAAEAGGGEAAAAAVASSVPLHQPVQPPALASVWPLASALQSLDIGALSPPDAASAAEAIRQLTGLQTLSITGDGWEQDRWDRAVVRQLAEAISDLPLLQSLSIDSMHELDATAAGDLAALTGLTELSLTFMGLTDSVLSRVCCEMLQLECLDVCGNRELTDAPWPLLMQRLPRLWDVDCSDCAGMTDKGMEWVDECSRSAFIAIELAMYAAG